MDKETLIKALQQDKAGFAHIQIEAEKVLNKLSMDATLVLAKDMYKSEIYQSRMFAVLILGRIASSLSDALTFLALHVVPDDNWRVQEMLARAFDQYCKDKGYEQSLPTIRRWLEAEHPNQRRAVTEGFRIWTSRPYFRDHPEVAIRLLASLNNDESEYVRKSVGNALRDISRKFPEEVKRELASWDVSNRDTLFTYKLASKFVA